MHWLKATRVVLAVLALGMVCICGCRVSSSGGEDEEEAHAQPPHRPASFEAAIPDLEARFGAVKNAASQAKRPSSTELSEIRDIVRWLPELAGETDLRREDWEQVKETGEQLERSIADWFSESNSEKKEVKVDPQCEAILTTLGRLANKAKASSRIAPMSTAASDQRGE